jgi:hypothetical protein
VQAGDHDNISSDSRKPACGSLDAGAIEIGITGLTNMIRQHRSYHAKTLLARQRIELRNKPNG